MSKFITITLEVKSGEDEEWMKEKVRDALVKHDQNALECVSHFLVAFEPNLQWESHEIITYSLLVHMEDESGDATITTFMEEHPDLTQSDAVTFAQGFLTWAQGPYWFNTPQAKQFLHEQRS